MSSGGYQPSSRFSKPYFIPKYKYVENYYRSHLFDRPEVVPSVRYKANSNIGSMADFLYYNTQPKVMRKSPAYASSNVINAGCDIREIQGELEQEHYRLAQRYLNRPKDYFNCLQGETAQDEFRQRCYDQYQKKCQQSLFDKESQPSAGRRHFGLHLDQYYGYDGLYWSSDEIKQKIEPGARKHYRVSNNMFFHGSDQEIYWKW